MNHLVKEIKRASHTISQSISLRWDLLFSPLFWLNCIAQLLKYLTKEVFQ